MPQPKPIPFSEITTKQKILFWLKVKKGQPDECWPWIGCIKGKGYGNVRINKVYLGTSRAGWMIIHGTDPYPLDVLHTCDNRRCCNPAHWFLGTNKDNCQDKARKLRNGRKLDPKTVVMIKRALHAKLGTHQEIGQVFGVAASVIGAINTGLIWKYVLVDY